MTWRSDDEQPDPPEWRDLDFSKPPPDGPRAWVFDFDAPLPAPLDTPEMRALWREMNAARGLPAPALAIAVEPLASGARSAAYLTDPGRLVVLHPGYLGDDHLCTAVGYLRQCEMVRPPYTIGARLLECYPDGRTRTVQASGEDYWSMLGAECTPAPMGPQLSALLALRTARPITLPYVGPARLWLAEGEWNDDDLTFP